MTMRRRFRLGAAAAVAAAVAVCLASGVVWTVRHRSAPTASGDDCAVVAGLARQWKADSERSMGILHRDGGEPSAEADDTAKLAQKARAAVGSVSNSEIKAELGNWADGFAQLAGIIREDAQRASSGPDSPDEQRRMQDAGDRIYSAAAALHRICPAAFG